MLSNLSVTTKALLVASVFGFSLTATAVALGNIPSPFASLASVTALQNKVCYTPNDLSLLETEKKNLEASKVSLAAELKVAEKEKADLTKTLTASTTALNSLKAKLPTKAALDAATKKVEGLQKKIDDLNKKTSLTSVEIKNLNTYGTQLEDAKTALQRLRDLPGEYNKALASHNSKKTELELQIAAAVQKINGIKASQKTNTSDIAQVVKNINTVKANQCKATCIQKEEATLLSSYNSIISSSPGKIKSLNNELTSAKNNLKKAEDEMKAAEAVMKKATPAAIAAAKKKYEDLKAQYEAASKAPVGSPLYNSRINLNKLRGDAHTAYIELFNAEMKYGLKKSAVDTYKKRIAEHPVAIKKLEAELKTAQTEKPKLQEKSMAVKGTVCAVAGGANGRSGTGGSSGSGGSGGTGGGGNNSNTNSNVYPYGLTPDEIQAIRDQVNAWEQDTADFVQLGCISKYGPNPDCSDAMCINHPSCPVQSCSAELKKTQTEVFSLDDQMQSLEASISALSNDISTLSDLLANSNPDSTNTDELNNQIADAQSQINQMCSQRESLDDQIRAAVREYNGQCPDSPVQFQQAEEVINIPQCRSRIF